MSIDLCPRPHDGAGVWRRVATPQRILRTLATTLIGLSTASLTHGAYDGPSVSPRLFFTDLQSGPGRGGQDDLGAFVTIWGEGFGATRGASSVTIGGVEVGRYVAWGEDNALARGMDMIVVQPGPSAVSGNIVVTINGLASNPLPFTVRDGHIYYVNPQAASASDSNPGTYELPFRSIYRPRQVVQAGDIVYLQGGTYSTIDPSNPGWDTLLIFDMDVAATGTSERPIAYVGYPGQRPVLGNPAARRGILLMTSEPPRDHYVIANVAFTQSMDPMPVIGTGHRIVGNHFYDGARGDGGAIGVNGNTSAIRILGNLLERNGTAGDKLNHGIYLGGFGVNRDIEVGWNEVRQQRGGRAVQLFGHIDGDRMEDVRIHDNLFAGSELNNLVLGGSDGATEVLGSVEVVNNIIAGAGDPGLRVEDSQGTVVIRHNTFFQNGTPGFDGRAQLALQRAGAGRITLQNNIFVAGAGQGDVLFGAGVDSSVFATASHNLVHGVSACAAWNGNCVRADPLFVNAGAGDYRLQPASPARDVAAAASPASDHRGLARPQGAGADIGAFEYVEFDTARFQALSDCLFNWAESHYATLFAPAGAASATWDVYYYRYYASQMAYLGSATADGQVYYMAPATGGVATSVGSLSGWLAVAGCVAR